mmetsp:Transcript_20993/g.29300  ORF Transcript_20993/g.29300 Transcript_20993/m.29300 type:complete len:543 (+) Transcript_20993:486-2114(+)
MLFEQHRKKTDELGFSGSDLDSPTNSAASRFVHAAETEDEEDEEEEEEEEEERKCSNKGTGKMFSGANILVDLATHLLRRHVKEEDISQVVTTTTATTTADDDDDDDKNKNKYTASFSSLSLTLSQPESAMLTYRSPLTFFVPESIVSSSHLQYHHRGGGKGKPPRNAKERRRWQEHLVQLQKRAIRKMKRVVSIDPLVTSPHLATATKELERRLRSIRSLPLTILGVLPSHPALRSTAPFPPVPILRLKDFGSQITRRRMMMAKQQQQQQQPHQQTTLWTNHHPPRMWAAAAAAAPAARRGHSIWDGGGNKAAAAPLSKPPTGATRGVIRSPNLHDMKSQSVVERAPPWSHASFGSRSAAAALAAATGGGGGGSRAPTTSLQPPGFADVKRYSDNSESESSIDDMESIPGGGLLSGGGGGGGGGDDSHHNVDSSLSSSSSSSIGTEFKRKPLAYWTIGDVKTFIAQCGKAPAWTKYSRIFEAEQVDGATLAMYTSWQPLVDELSIRKNHARVIANLVQSYNNSNAIGFKKEFHEEKRIIGA